MNDLSNNHKMIEFSEVEKQLIELDKSFPNFDPEKSLLTFRERDYNLHLDLLKEQMEHISVLTGMNCSVKVVKNSKHSSFLYDKMRLFDELVFTFEHSTGKVETQKVLLPTLYKGNYLVLNNFYTLGLFLDVGLINSFAGKRYKLIRLGIDTIKHIGGKGDNPDTIVFGNKQFDKGHFLNLLLTMDDKDSNQTLLEAMGITNEHVSFKDFFETQMFIPFYREVMRRHLFEIYKLTQPKLRTLPTQTADDKLKNMSAVDLLIEAIKVDLELDIPYHKTHHRRVISSELLFQKVYWFQRNVVTELLNGNGTPKANNRLIVNAFRTLMHSSSIYSKSTPINYELFKISQSLGKGGKDTKLKGSWRTYDLETHFKLFCPISVSAGNMAKNLYFTQYAMIDDYGKPTRSNQSLLFSPQAYKSALAVGSLVSARGQMAQKYFQQILYSSNMKSMYLTPAKSFYDGKYSIFNEYAEEDGHVVEVGRTMIKVAYVSGKSEIIQTPIFKTTDKVNGVMLEWTAKKGEQFKQGDRLVQYHDPNKNAYRAKVCYLPFFGFTADDAIVVSEQQAITMTATYGHTHYVVVSKKLNLSELPELDRVYIDEPAIQFTHKRHLNKVSIKGYVHDMKFHHIKGSLDELDDVKTRLLVEDVINAQIAEFEHYNFTDEEIELNYAKTSIQDVPSFDDVKSSMSDETASKREVIREMRNRKDKNPVFNKNQLEKISSQHKIQVDDIIGVIEINTIEHKVAGIGDKLVPNTYAGKGVISLVIPDEFTPTIKETGDKVDVFFNTVGFPRRNNWTAIIEGHLALLVEDIEDEKNREVRKEKMRFVRDNLLHLNRIDTQYKLWLDEDYLDKLADSIEKGFLTFNFEGDEHRVTFKVVEKVLKDYNNKFNTTLGHLQTIQLSEDLFAWLEEKGYDMNYLDYYKGKEIKALVLPHSMLRLNQTSDSKANISNLDVGRNSVNGQYFKGRQRKGGTASSWLLFSALLMTHWDETKTPLYELYSIMFLKSDAEKALIEEVYEKLIEHGRDYDLSDFFKEKHFSSQTQFLNSLLAYLNLELKSTDLQQLK